jgi:pSer/pThr/pTyr-binding forkhead associated (FHA) protein
MAYLIFTANGCEVDRRKLDRPLVIGRAPDCDVPLKDIVLSRKHCRVEPADVGGWRIIDLGSKNGSFLQDRTITEHLLKGDDELRIGRTVVLFRDAEFEPAAPGTVRPDRTVRPDDPEQALAGTVYGFELVLPDDVERTPGAPVPQPQPRAPRSYTAETVQRMISDIVSSSWDSIHETNSRPLPTAVVLGRSRRGTCASLEIASNDDAPRRRLKRPAEPPRPAGEMRRRRHAMTASLVAVVVLALGGWWTLRLVSGGSWSEPATVEAAPAPMEEVNAEPDATAQLVSAPLAPSAPTTAPAALDWSDLTSHLKPPPPAARLLIAKAMLF